MGIDVLKKHEFHEDAMRIVAQCLLAQARISPTNCDCTPKEQCFCQYVIEGFEIDSEEIKIVEDGVEYTFIVHRKGVKKLK